MKVTKSRLDYTVMKLLEWYWHVQRMGGNKLSKQVMTCVFCRKKETAAEKLFGCMEFVKWWEKWDLRKGIEERKKTGDRQLDKFKWMKKDVKIAHNLLLITRSKKS